MPDNPLSFDDRVSHLAAGYNNSQSVVQFLDAKAGVVIGVVPVVLACLAAVFVWFYDEVWQLVVGSTKSWVPIGFVAVMVVAAGAVLLYAWAALAAAFKAVSPQNTGKALPSVLFPFDTPDFKARVAVFTGNPVEQNVIEDYERQILRMSEIVRRKLEYVNRSIGHLRRMFAWSAGWLAALLVAAIIGAATAAVDDPSPTPAVQQTPTTAASTQPTTAASALPSIGTD